MSPDWYPRFAASRCPRGNKSNTSDGGHLGFCFMKAFHFRFIIGFLMRVVDVVTSHVNFAFEMFVE